MKKVKKLWNDNRVMFVLGIIVFFCILIILLVMFQYFFGTSSSSYGDRLDDISSVPFESSAEEQIKNGFDPEHTLDVSVSVKGKVVYIIAKFDETVSMSAAQGKAVEVYQAVDESYRNLYDFNVTIVQDATEINTGYCMMGAKNVSGDSFSWSNSTPISDGE